MNRMLMCVGILALLAGCGDATPVGPKPPIQPQKIHYEHYVAQVADASGVKGKEGHLPFGERCALTKGSSVVPLGHSGKGYVYRYDGKGLNGPVIARFYKDTGVRVTTYEPVDVELKEQCPADSLVLLPWYEARQIERWHNYQVGIEKLDAAAKAREQPLEKQ